MSTLERLTQKQEYGKQSLNALNFLRTKSGNFEPKMFDFFESMQNLCNYLALGTLEVVYKAKRVFCVNVTK